MTAPTAVEVNAKIDAGQPVTFYEFQQVLRAERIEAMEAEARRNYPPSREIVRTDAKPAGRRKGSRQ